MSLQIKMQKLKALTVREWSFLLIALVMLPLTVLALRLFGFRRFQHLLKQSESTQDTTSEPALNEAAKQAARMVSVAARFGLCRATCLPQALTLVWLLRFAGLESQLRIGVRKEDETLKAHAWVEREGMVLNDSADVNQRFAAFPGLIFPAGVEVP